MADGLGAGEGGGGGRTKKVSAGGQSKAREENVVTVINTWTLCAQHPATPQPFPAPLDKLTEEDAINPDYYDAFVTYLLDHHANDLSGRTINAYFGTALHITWLIHGTTGEWWVGAHRRTRAWWWQLPCRSSV